MAQRIYTLSAALWATIPVPLSLTLLLPPTFSCNISSHLPLRRQHASRVSVLHLGGQVVLAAGLAREHRRGRSSPSGRRDTSRLRRQHAPSEQFRVLTQQLNNTKAVNLTLHVALVVSVPVSVSISVFCCSAYPVTMTHTRTTPSTSALGIRRSGSHWRPCRIRAITWEALP